MNRGHMGPGGRRRPPVDSSETIRGTRSLRLPAESAPPAPTAAAPHHHEPFREEEAAMATPKRSTVGSKGPADMSPQSSSRGALYASPLDSRVPKPVRDYAHQSRMVFLNQQLSEVEELPGPSLPPSHQRAHAVSVHRHPLSSLSPLRDNGLILEDPFEVRSSSRKLLLPVEDGLLDDDEEDDDYGEAPSHKNEPDGQQEHQIKPQSSSANLVLSTSVCVSDMSDEEHNIGGSATPSPPQQPKEYPSVAQAVRPPVNLQIAPSAIMDALAAESGSFGNHEESIFCGGLEEHHTLSLSSSSSSSSSSASSDRDAAEMMEKSVQRYCAKDAMRRCPSLIGAASFADVVARMLTLEHKRQQETDAFKSYQLANQSSVIFEFSTTDSGWSAGEPQVIAVSAVPCRGELPNGGEQPASALVGALSTEQVDAMCINMTVLPFEEDVRTRRLRMLKKGRRIFACVVIALVIIAAVIGGLAGAKKLR